MIHGYDVPTAAQAAAFFARKSGGTINVLKLVKLMYMAERCYMEQYDEPLFYDTFVSMDYGPVPSTTLNLINGMISKDVWSDYIGNRMGNDIQSVGDKPLNHISAAEEKVLSYVWDKFKDVDRFDLAKWTHENCPEWENPRGSSKPISHELVFKFLGKNNASELNNEIENFRRAKAVMAMGN